MMTQDPQDIAKQIVKFSLFKEFEQDSAPLQELVKLLHRESFQIRDFIIDERKNNGRMYFLLSGQVVISKMDENGQIVVIGRADAKASPCFGESVLLGSLMKSASVTAHSPCECYSLSAKDFENFMASHPFVVASIYRNMAKVLFERLIKANQDIFIAGLSAGKN